MTAWDGDFLLEALRGAGVEDPSSVTHVVCTHGHSDHVGCNYLFANALHIVGKSVSRSVKDFLNSILHI